MRNQSSRMTMMKTGIGGLAGATVDVVSLVILVERLGVSLGWAAFVSVGLGAICGFLMSKFWAFADKTPIAVRQVASYGLVALGTAILVTVSMRFLVVLGAAYLLAKLIASISVFALWSYPAQSRWVFANV